MMEINAVIVVALVALLYPSLISLVYFALYNALFWSMTKSIKTRFLWNITILTMLLIGQIFLVYYKMKVPKKILTGDVTKFTNLEEYKKACAKLLDFGYIFTY